jgi:CheY-like chemotaxis protein
LWLNSPDLDAFSFFYQLRDTTGLDALNKMRTVDHISLVLLDLWMPLMDGREVLSRKRGDPGIAEIPVVVLSAVPPVSLDGADQVLRKPVDLGSFVDTVRRLSK